jgi:8-oxo-dGTP diphosphatase
MSAYTPILATLGYVLSADGTEVLLIHRNTRPDDPAYGKYNGLGGKLERDENVTDGMRREIREEAGIEATEMMLRGTISWPGFGKNGEDWFGFIFVIMEWTGTPLTHNHEGTLCWTPVSRLVDGELDLWPGDRYFLPLVFNLNKPAFHGVMPYRDGKPERWHVSS